MRNTSDQTEKNLRLNEEQFAVFKWLKQQGLNTDEETLNYWSRKYPAKRLIDVVQFANERRNSGQPIRNIGGWIHKLLKTDAAVVNDECKENRDLAQKFAQANQWSDLDIFEKYIRDKVTDSDLPLTMPRNDFSRALEALYNRSKLYKEL